MRKLFSLPTLLVLFALSLLFTKGGTPRFFLSESQSMKRGLYRVLDKRAPRVGDIVVAELPDSIKTSLEESAWLPPSMPLLKRVIGLEGATYCNEKNVFLVNGAPYGPIFQKDSDGRALPRFSHCKVVPLGHVLLFGEGIERSFDSRYFGALPEAGVRAEVELVFSY